MRSLTTSITIGTGDGQGAWSGQSNEKHRAIAAHDLDELQRGYEDVLCQSKEARERKFDQRHIAELPVYERLDLELANKSLRTHGLCAFMA